ncbi:hypothetical protein GCM10028778_20860 [Barrientosiimonas marina]|uniref:Uncharacterized protein n=1 Tax=Lentibacillus kimchii TaxID=1542911 RepID=A0ABW2UY86_9BACI
MTAWLIAITITILLFIVQHFASISRIPWLGTIIPTALAIVIVSMLVLGKLEINSSRDLFFMIAGPLVFLSLWGEGRNSLKRKRKKELNKMKTWDLRD